MAQHIKVSWLQLSEDVDSSEYLVYLLDLGSTLVYGVTTPTNRLTPPGKGNTASWAVPSVPEGNKRIAVVEVGQDGKTRFVINTTTSIAAGSPGSFLIPSNELVPQSSPSPVDSDQDSTGNGVMDSQDPNFVKNTIVSTITDALGNTFIVVTLAGGTGTEEPRTVYTFGGDVAGQPPNYGGSGWPLVKVQGTINAVPPMTATVSSDGNGNLLINGLPVYQYQGDTGPQGQGGVIANWNTLDRTGSPQGVNYVNTNNDDIDGDGIPNIIDADYPGNDTEPDTDGDGIIDSGDPDDDNDGILDGDDLDPLDSNVGTTLSDTDGDGISDDLELQGGSETLLDNGTGITVGGSTIPITGELKTFLDDLAGFSDGGSGADIDITKNPAGTGQEHTVPATSVPGMPLVSGLYDPATGLTTIIAPGTTITIPPGGFIITGVPKIQTGGGFQIGGTLNLYPTGTIIIGGASGNGEPDDILLSVGDNDLTVIQNNSSTSQTVVVPGSVSTDDIYVVWNPLTGDETVAIPGSTITLPPGYILIGGKKDLPVAVSIPSVSHSPNAISTLAVAHDPSAVSTPTVGADPGVVNNFTVQHDPNSITSTTVGKDPEAPSTVTNQLMNQPFMVYGNDGTNGVGYYYPLYQASTALNNVQSLVIDGVTYYYDSTDITFGGSLQPSGFTLAPNAQALPNFYNWNYAYKAYYEGQPQDILGFTETTVTLSEAGVVSYTVSSDYSSAGNAGGNRDDYTDDLNTELGTSYDLTAYYFGDQLQQIFKQKIVNDSSLVPTQRMVIDSDRFPIISADLDENPNWTWSSHQQELFEYSIDTSDPYSVLFYQDHQTTTLQNLLNPVYTKDSNNQITSFTLTVGGSGWDSNTNMPAGTHTFTATNDDGTNYGSAPLYTDIGFPEGIVAGRYKSGYLQTSSGGGSALYFISFTDPNNWYSNVYQPKEAYLSRSGDNFRAGGIFAWKDKSVSGMLNSSSGTWSIPNNWLDNNLPLAVYKLTDAVADPPGNYSIPSTGLTPADTSLDAEAHNPVGTVFSWDPVGGADRYEVLVRCYGDGGNASNYTSNPGSWGSTLFSDKFDTTTTSFTFPDDPFAKFEGLYYISVKAINDATGDYIHGQNFTLLVRLDTDNDGTFNVSDTDDDGDGVLDTNDSFPLDPNRASGTDTDGDGIDDEFDTDDDNDGVLDTADAFPLDASESADTDGDGVGDNADIAPNNSSISGPPVENTTAVTVAEMSSTKTASPFATAAAGGLSKNDIQVDVAGAEYEYLPAILISEQNTGSGAKIRATLTNKTISDHSVTDPGNSYQHSDTEPYIFGGATPIKRAFAGHETNDVVYGVSPGFSSENHWEIYKNKIFSTAPKTPSNSLLSRDLVLNATSASNTPDDPNYSSLKAFWVDTSNYIDNTSMPTAYNGIIQVTSHEDKGGTAKQQGIFIVSHGNTGLKTDLWFIGHYNCLQDVAGSAGGTTGLGAQGVDWDTTSPLKLIDGGKPSDNTIGWDKQYFALSGGSMLFQEGTNLHGSSTSSGFGSVGSGTGSNYHTYLSSPRSSSSFQVLTNDAISGMHTFYCGHEFNLFYKSDKKLYFMGRNHWTAWAPGGNLRNPTPILAGGYTGSTGGATTIDYSGKLNPGVFGPMNFRFVWHPIMTWYDELDSGGAFIEKSVIRPLYWGIHFTGAGVGDSIDTTVPIKKCFRIGTDHNSGKSVHDYADNTSVPTASDQNGYVTTIGILYVDGTVGVINFPQAPCDLYSNWRSAGSFGNPLATDPTLTEISAAIPSGVDSVSGVDYGDSKIEFVDDSGTVFVKRDGVVITFSASDNSWYRLPTTSHAF